MASMMGFFNRLFMPTDIFKQEQQDNNALYKQGNIITVDNQETGDVVNFGYAGSNFQEQMSSFKDQVGLVNEYRCLSYNPEVDNAIDDIVNAIISCDEDENPVQINLENLADVSEETKKKIAAAFNKILLLLDFNATAYEKIRQWYVDGQLNYQIVTDETSPKKGIQKLVLLDPRCIRKTIAYTNAVNAQGIEYVANTEKYFAYSTEFLRDAVKPTGNIATQNKRSMTSTVHAPFRIHADSIVQVTSGLAGVDNRLILSDLDKCRRTLNNLRLTENAAVVNRITRAGQKLAFYVDVGNLSGKAADAKLQSAMAAYKNNMIYNGATGTVEGKPHTVTMQENYWLARSGNGKSAEIATIEGASNVDEIDDILMHRKALYNSLNVPASRLDDGGSVNLLGSRAAEITREEWKFSKFIARKRRKFSELFYGLLKYELISTNVADIEQWNAIKPSIKFNYTSDSYQKEQAELDDLQQKIGMLGDIQPLIGEYFSKETVERVVLGRTEEFSKAERDRIASEIKRGLIKDPSSDEG